MKNKVFEKFLDYEYNNHLFDIEFEGFKIWELLRTYIYIDIEQIYNNLQPLFPVNSTKVHREKNIKCLFKSLKLLLIKNQDFVFLNNPRRVKEDDGKYYCIYTDLLIDLLKADYKCVTFEDPYWALSPSSNISHFEPVKTENICYLDLMEYIFKIKKYFYKRIFNNKYKKLHSIIENIENDIEKEFSCNLSNIFKVGEEKILYMILTYKLYKKIIKRVKPKAVLEFYDVFPSKIVINKIAKEFNIPVIEIQHGVVTESNPIFLKYYDVERKYDCLPDYVLSYGKKLLNTNMMPIKKENIYYIGSLFLDSKKDKYKNETIFKKNILFISQSNLGKYLSECAGKLADLLKDDSSYQIIYKMHPYEIGANYSCLDKKNITVVNNRDKDLYYYHAISFCQIGVYSTGLYEGLAFGLKTFILNNCYGANEVKSMLKESNNIKYVDSADEIFENIKNAKESNVFEDYWEKVDFPKIKNIITSIINKSN